MVIEQTPFESGGGGIPAGLRQCTFCAAIAYPGDDYCASCGHSLPGAQADPATLVCASCGTSIRLRIAFHCPRCGASLHRHGSVP